MRVGITGAQGFTGLHLVAALISRGHDALPIASDITDAAAISAELEMSRPDAVVHLAALAFVNSDDYASFYAVNQVGSFNLLKAAQRARPDCTVLLASSAQVYGAGASGLIDEFYQPTPANHYALSKWAMELGVGLVTGDLRVIVVRPFNYTGRGQQTRYLIPKIVDHLRRREPVIELGNIDVRRDIGDVRSVVDAYVRLLETREANGTYNIATGRSCSVREILAMAQELAGYTPTLAVNPALVRARDVTLLVGDPSRLMAALPDWHPRDLADTLRWMLLEA